MGMERGEDAWGAGGPERLIAVQQDGSAQGAAPESPATITVPSGQIVTLQEVIWNAPGPDGLTSRFRFIAPEISGTGGTVDTETALADMLWLCQNYALPRIAQPGPMPSQIVISLADAPVPFGEARPEVTQLFEAYSLQDGQCVWEVF
jgi:hypothetical protein